MGFLPEQPYLERHQVYTEERSRSVVVSAYDDGEGSMVAVGRFECDYEVVPDLIRALQETLARNPVPNQEEHANV